MTQVKPVARKSIKFPLRFQITLLLLGFVAVVAVAFFYLTFNFVERDKLGTTRELQTFQVVDASRRLNERITKIRVQLREAGIKILDPNRQGKLDETKFTWIWVRGKSWKSESLGDAEIPGLEQFTIEGDKFSISSDSSSPNHVIVKEPLFVREKGREFKILIYGHIPKTEIFGDAASLSRGPLKGVLMDLSGISEGFKPSTVEQLKSRAWLGEASDIEKFSTIFLGLKSESQVSLAQPLRGATREFPILDDAAFISWSSVDPDEAGPQLIAFAFSKRSDILNAFKTTKLALGLMVLLVVGLGIVVAGLLGGRLSRPIENLVKATQQLETGNFDVRVDSKRSDEIGELASSFNHMGQALQEREQALIAAQGALVQNEKLAALGTLSAGIAHEIKNPLAGILGHADMTVQRIKNLSGIDGAPVLKHLETIQKEVKRCRGIIDNLMRFSRQDKGGKSDYENIDLELVAWDAVHLMEHPLNLAKVRVEKEFTADARMIFGNSNQVEQVLLNMLQNAGHAMPEGGIVKISTEYFSDGANAPVGAFVAAVHPEFQGPFMRISVTDKGIGMTEEVQKKIFEPFFTTKPKGVGTGLGLSVTMAILADHKARVSLNSAPGKGTAFMMDFMEKEPRNKAVFAQLEELKARTGGGPAVSTDISVKKEPQPEAQIAGGNFSEKDSTSENTRDLKEFTLNGGFRPPPPKDKSQIKTAPRPPVGGRFSLRKPSTNSGSSKGGGTPS